MSISFLLKGKTLAAFSSSIADLYRHYLRWKYGLGQLGKGAIIGRNVEFIGVTSGIKIGARARIGDGARLVCVDVDAEIRIGDGTTIHPRAILETGPGGKIILGRSNSVNPYCVLYGHGGFFTGDFVRIAAHTVVIPASHIFDSLDRPIAKQGLRKAGIHIQSNVWIGCGCSVLDGVQIGEGAVIAAGCVLNRNVPAYAVVGGVPGKVLKMRTDSLAQ